MTRSRACGWKLLLMAMMIFSSASLRAELPLIARGEAGWRFLDRPMPVDGWPEPHFDDQAWAEGQALLGFGDQDVVTQVVPESEGGADPVAILFRKRFTLSERERIRHLRGRLVCDDGVVVYLNGRELYRWNMPQGQVTVATFASRSLGPGPDERDVHSFAVPAELLRDGENVLAVSVHQATTNSRDLALDLELTGLESDEELAQLEQEIQSQRVARPEVVEASLRLGVE